MARHPSFWFVGQLSHIMFDPYIFSHLLGCVFRRSEPLETITLDPLGYEPGLVIRPKLTFPEVLAVGLGVEVHSL